MPRRARLIVGTSAGSVVAASLRAGLGPADMRRRLAGEPLSPEGATLVGRAEAAVAALAASDERSNGDERRRHGGGDGVRDDRPPVADRVAGACAAGASRTVAGHSWLASCRRCCPPGRRSTAHLRVPYDAMLGRRWPDEDVWIVAVELDVGPRVVFGRPGAPVVTVGEAVEASCAIPGYFSPVTIDGARYVDGGVHSTTNADLVADCGSAAGPRDRGGADVGGQWRGAADADALVASARPPPGRRGGRRPARQGDPDGHVPADGRRSRRDGRRHDGSGQGVDRVCPGRRSRHWPTFASPTSPNGSPRYAPEPSAHGPAPLRRAAWTQRDATSLKISRSSSAASPALSATVATTSTPSSVAR